MGKFFDLEKPKYNTYNFDKSRTQLKPTPPDFRTVGDWGSNTHGINSYDRVGHRFDWIIPFDDITNKAQNSVSLVGDKIKPIWGVSKKEGSYSYSSSAPLEDSKILYDFLSCLNQVIDFKGSYAKEEILKFTSHYGTLVVQPDLMLKSTETPTPEAYDSLNLFIEHWKICAEIYDLYSSKENPKEMRRLLNIIMEEVTIGTFPKKMTGRTEFVHDDPYYSDRERKVAKPPLEKDGKQGGIRMLEESAETIVGYQISSLRACISIHLFDLITGFLNTLQCVECGNHYLSQKKGKKTQNNFCSNKCGNNFRVRKHRGKQ